VTTSQSGPNIAKFAEPLIENKTIPEEIRISVNFDFYNNYLNNIKVQNERKIISSVGPRTFTSKKMSDIAIGNLQQVLG
jgi:hypothetical protein